MALEVLRESLRTVLPLSVTPLPLCSARLDVRCRLLGQKSLGGLESCGVGGGCHQALGSSECVVVLLVY